MTYKKIEKLEDEYLLVCADNDFYEPYEIPLTDVLEIWEYAASIATTEFTKDDFNLDHQTVISMFRELKTELHNLKKH